MIKLKQLIIENENDTINTAKIIIKNGDEVLLLQKPTGKWTLPGGHIQKNESPLNALKRELYEETQIKLSGEPKLLYKTLNNENGTYFIFIYETDNKIEPILDEEHISWNYYKKEDFPENIDTGLEKYQNG